MAQVPQALRTHLLQLLGVVAPMVPRGPGARAMRDLVLAVVLGMLSGAAVLMFDTSERFIAFASMHEEWQLDELPLLLLTSSILLAWLAGRRWADAETALRAQIQAEHRVRELLQENQRLLCHALEAQEEERGNLARELHDELGQYLHAARAEAVALRFSLQGQALAERALSIETSLTHIAQATREQIGRLRPPALDELGLSSAIEYLLERQSMASANLDWSAQLTRDLDRLPPAVAIQVYRIVQESLTNVVRHAQASCVTVTATRQPNALILQVQDDGRGMQQPQSHGFGLPGMRERVESFHGRLQIHSVPQQGVAVTVHIPFVEEPHP